MTTPHPWPCEYPARPLCACPRGIVHAPDALRDEQAAAEARADGEALARAAAFRREQEGRRAREGRQRKTGDPREDRRRAWARMTAEGNPLRGLIDAFDAEARRIEEAR